MMADLLPGLVEVGGALAQRELPVPLQRPIVPTTPLTRHVATTCYLPSIPSDGLRVLSELADC